MKGVKWLIPLTLAGATAAMAAEDLDYDQGDSLTEPAEKQFGQVDSDGNNRVDAEEAEAAGFSREFDSYDRNDDGELTLEEYNDLDRRMGHDTLNP